MHAKVVLCFATWYLHLIILWCRNEKIQRLCRVVGNDFPQDPDEAYELTTDNAKKMMAIFMRFRFVLKFVHDLNIYISLQKRQA